MKKRNLDDILDDTIMALIHLAVLLWMIVGMFALYHWID